MSDTMSTAFADPAKYDLYDCKQLETERKTPRQPRRGSAGADGEGRNRRCRPCGGRSSPIATNTFRSADKPDLRKTPGSAASATRCLPRPTPAVTHRQIPEWRSRPPNPRSLRARAGRSTRISLHSPKPTVANSTAQSLHNHSPPRLTGHVNRTGQIRFARSG